ncbi:CLUMA_CG012110, isoform A [Clunio marinus]|uniref:CLUMA_CG012110, isoform A n=1 Tax=Clunio marinus TaxID=568069 RepID=A0A1J1IFT6_9DIPT|nr:CLUMA_CG012110, isoform A [Clunio marinus]
MEPKGSPAGVFPHKNKPSSIHISQQSQESTTAAVTTNLIAPLTPRIDISRASSSSYHEDSSPENVFDQVGTGTLQEATGCLELFQEDVDELRSSTEELYFMEKEKGQTECEKPSSAAQVSRAPMIFKFDDSQALQNFNQYNRKDSGSSEVAAFLNPSGRTSRISSVGSQGSAVSRLSGASGVSRSPSPHKMLVETSFCGPKPIEPTSDASSIEQLTADMLENVILARRGDPTRVVLAEGVEVKQEVKPKTTKEKLEEPMTPAEAARAAAKEARRKEIEALKQRLNAINAKQLEKAKGISVTKKVVGVTPEGTEYIRIKLKPDHLYEDNGISPNERIVEEKDFKETGTKKKKDTLKDNTVNQISTISPTTHAIDNRSPSPASTSVSRKSSFCSFFKSKDTSNESTSSKPRSASAASGKGRLNDKSPLPSPSKSSSLSSRIAFSLFKTNRNPSPSQLETSNDGATSTKQHQSRQSNTNIRDKPTLKYYDTPDVIHIPLHTPPEEKEFSALKKKKEETETLTEVPPVVVEVKTSIPIRPKIAPTAQIEKMQSTDEIELQEIPTKNTTNEEGGSSLWSVEVQRHSSQESQETVISSQQQQKPECSSKNGMTEKPAIPAFIDTINENSSTSNNQPQPQQQQPMSAKGRHKKHILFSTKIGSGSEEQIFSTQLSLSKTESQSSQLSEQASVFESPKNEECGTKVQEVTINNLKHQSSSEVEKVTATSARSRRSDQSDSAESRPQSVTRRQKDSGDFSKKRESSDEVLKKKRESQSSNSNPSPISVSIPSQHSQNSLKQFETKTTSILEHQSSGSKMEISSESDRESDIEGCVHKRVSRVMEDHESAGLVLQESFDDELPYVPTTLPEERSSGLRIIPTKDRTQSELITIPVDSPRSTTPINPASLDNYCERKQSDVSECNLVRGEKLRISLPRQKAEQVKEKVQQKVITRRISNLSNKSWTEFAEQQQSSSSPATKKSEKNRKISTSSQDDDPSPPQPPPPKSHSKKSLTSKWIDFENIPEKRQPPKKITTIPTSKEPTVIDKQHQKHHTHHRQYVSPEECQCECHEASGKKDPDSCKQSPAESGKTTTSEDSQPLLDDQAERNSLMSTDSSMEGSLENDEANFHLQHPNGSQQSKSTNNNLDKPFGMDLSVEYGGHSNRSSVVSQDIKSPDVTLHK